MNPIKPTPSSPLSNSHKFYTVRQSINTNTFFTSQLSLVFLIFNIRNNDFIISESTYKIKTNLNIFKKIESFSMVNSLVFLIFNISKYNCYL